MTILATIPKTGRFGRCEVLDHSYTNHSASKESCIQSRVVQTPCESIDGQCLLPVAVHTQARSKGKITGGRKPWPGKTILSAKKSTFGSVRCQDGNYNTKR